MTKDEIIQLAKECELVAGNAAHGIYLMALQRFAALVAETEREACAKMCDESAEYCNHPFHREAIQSQAFAIRSRGNK